MLVWAFFTVTPCRVTSSGSLLWACATRFCTSVFTVSRSVPVSKYTEIDRRPSLDAFDCMYSMFSTPLIACSSGTATVSSTTCALAPG